MLATSDADTIKTFPRNIASTVRRVDTTRKEARERKKERQEQELEKKREEVRRLKALKMKEVRRKLERIGREGGVKIDSDTEGSLCSLHFVMTDIDAQLM
jgi:protein KRI1